MSMEGVGKPIPQLHVSNTINTQQLLKPTSPTSPSQLTTVPEHRLNHSVPVPVQIYGLNSLSEKAKRIVDCAMMASMHMDDELASLRLEIAQAEHANMNRAAQAQWAKERDSFECTIASQAAKIKGHQKSSYASADKLYAMTAERDALQTQRHAMLEERDGLHSALVANLEQMSTMTMELTAVTDRIEAADIECDALKVRVALQKDTLAADEEQHTLKVAEMEQTIAAGVKREQRTEDELKEMGAQLSTLRAEMANGARARESRTWLARESETLTASLQSERLPRHLRSDSPDSLDPDFVIEPNYISSMRRANLSRSRRSVPCSPTHAFQSTGQSNTRTISAQNSAITTPELRRRRSESDLRKTK